MEASDEAFTFKVAFFPSLTEMLLFSAAAFNPLFT